MAIAGKVAITLSAENGGAWSADVTYDRLVAVKHNNNLYISRKVVTNVEPPNNEFWFFALEGYSGEDVQALIDSMNAIITGTQQVGNAKTLDGHGAEYFAPKTDLANYLPLTGGKVSAAKYEPLLIENTANGASGVYVRFLINGVNKGQLGASSSGLPMFYSSIDSKGYELLYTGNKPTGTYTGNGDATERQINVGGIGQFLAIYSARGSIILTPTGGIRQIGDSISGIKNTEAKFDGGIIYLSTTTSVLNESGIVYVYWHL